MSRKFGMPVQIENSKIKRTINQNIPTCLTQTRNSACARLHLQIYDVPITVWKKKNKQTIQCIYCHVQLCLTRAKIVTTETCTGHPRVPKRSSPILVYYFIFTIFLFTFMSTPFNLFYTQRQYTRIS